MSRTVVFSLVAEDDLDRLFDFIIERELNSSTPNLDLADEALAAIKTAIAILPLSPFIGRRLTTEFDRELVISYGKTGYVAQYKINASEIIVGAIRHQLESDFH